jgi:hypothetical protein
LGHDVFTYILIGIASIVLGTAAVWLVMRFFTDDQSNETSNARAVEKGPGRRTSDEIAPRCSERERPGLGRWADVASREVTPWDHLEGKVTTLSATVSMQSRELQATREELKVLTADVSVLRDRLSRLQKSGWDLDSARGVTFGLPAASSERYRPVSGPVTDPWRPAADLVDETKSGGSAPSATGQLRTLLDRYCRREISQLTLLTQVGRLRLAAGAVDVNQTPPRFEEGRESDVFAIRSGDGAEIFVVVGDECPYSLGLSFFFDRGGARVGQKVFSSQPAVAILLTNGTIAINSQGVLEPRG